MCSPEPTDRYRVERRYTYSAVDEYNAEGQCIRTVIAGVTNKLAERIATALTDAYERGCVDGATMARGDA